jgi:hypothetical protein
VHECGSKGTGPSCFASGYEEYALLHVADGPVLTSKPGGKVFNFGVARVEARALAAEKYITIPLGSGDVGLISQPTFEKVEMAGRPLGGSFSFGILDSPTLRWEHLEDIQFVIKYRYWSPVAQ